MLRLAEVQIEEMSAAVEQAHHKKLRSQLIAKTAESAASERRALDAVTTTERIADVIQAQVPANLSAPTEDNAHTTRAMV